MNKVKEIKNLKIIDVKQSLSDRTGRAYFNVQTDDGYYNLFNDELADDISKQVGKTLECEIQINGRFKSIQKVIGLAPNTQSSTFQPYDEDKKNLSIVSQVALKEAVNCFNAGKIEFEKIAETADLFVTIMLGLQSKRSK